MVSKMNDEAVTPILGTVLMLPMMMGLLVTGMATFDAMQDAMRAQAESAELSAWCARNPHLEDDRCPERMAPDYDCKETAPGTMVCTRRVVPLPTDAAYGTGV